MASAPASPLSHLDALATRTLANGLRAIVLPDATTQSVAYFTTYRVGSRNEVPGITGISHLFEHMMFNGARKHGPKMFDQVIESNGGTSNAYTTHDVTAYYEVLPADRLEVILDLELDRMRDLEVTERNLESERGVVKEERRLRTDESPLGALLEHLYATAFLAHPYRWPVIGWMADLDAITVADCQDYHRTHYAPNNAVVTICGGVDPAAALDAVERWLAELVPQPPARAVVRSEPQQRGERRVLLRKEAQLPSFLSSFHAVDAGSPDLFVLDVLQSILTEGDSSRLRRRLVLDEALLVDVGADFPWTLDPGLFTCIATVRPGVEPARAQAALHEELARLGAEPVAERELQKAKNQLTADFYRRLKTNEGRADLLGVATVVLGAPERLFELPSRYAAVTTEDLRRVAAATFSPDNRTVAELVPLAPGAEQEAGDD